MVSPNTGFSSSPQPLTDPQQHLTRAPYPAGQPQPNVTEAALELFKEYSRERPEVVAMWAFGIGFVLGWKLKPW